MVCAFQSVSSFPYPLRNIKVENVNTDSSKDIEIQGGGGAVYPVVHLAFALINLISCSLPLPCLSRCQTCLFLSPSVCLGYVTAADAVAPPQVSTFPSPISSLCSSNLLRLWSLKEALAANYPEGVCSCIALCWNTDVRDLCCCIDQTVRTWCLLYSSLAFALLRRALS